MRLYYFFCIVKRFLYILLVFISSTGNAQLLDNSKGNAFSSIPFFNESFIKNNHIKGLHGNFSNKKIGDRIRGSEYIYEYKFDENGRLTYSLETKPSFSNTVDTLILFYGYDDKGNLSYIRQKDYRGYWSTHYTYDDENRKIKEEYRRDIDTISDDILSPSFERSTVLNFETMKYQVDQNQTKMTRYNNYNFPYIEEIYQYNSDGYLIKKEEKLKMTSQSTFTTYEYTDKGWLARITTETPKNPNSNQEVQFKYDDAGNLTEKQIFKHGVHQTEIQLIYNSKTGLISYILTRDVPSNFISILKFDKYDYY